MNWTTDRAPLDDNGDYPHPAHESLVTAVGLLGHFVSELTGDDLCNWETNKEFSNDTFVLRGGSPDDDTLPNFSFGEPGSGEEIDISWYKELGRVTTVSRNIGVMSAAATVGMCLASLDVELPDRVDDLYLYGVQADPQYVAGLLSVAQAVRALN